MLPSQLSTVNCQLSTIQEANLVSKPKESTENSPKTSSTTHIPQIFDRI
ncbi:MAG: hypothetical protein JGK14_14020 [Microcoleus sp. PH2017_28_MFU_U_A]|nr:hypothetical protein [Microcoleus sp. PH2017_28_MFU_U_A]